jgi:hypothetical protein
MEKKGQQIAEALRWVHVPTNGIGHRVVKEQCV